ncbi:AMP-binding protein (plasmid) [Ralstonia sp. 25C]|uniref:AMP-binding protein n=1 Tax=Ralstonia sp. 25C TaxID=3447363 RepID=UPI003F74BEFC
MRLDLNTGSFVDTGLRPEHDAVIGDDRTLSWQALAAEAAHWCEQARAAGFATDVPVIIRGHKEAAFFVAMAGALMLGAPFVPVDTIYPDERMDRIARTLGAHAYYDARTATFEALPYASHPQPLQEKGLAYVLFTSGTTGEPKGVQIGRESVQTLVDWMADDFALGSAPVFLNQAPFSFDLSMYEVMATLALGGTVVLASRDAVAQGEAFLQKLAVHGLTTWVSTPSFAQQQLLQPAFSAQVLPTLDTFLFCGEVLPVTLARHLRKRFPSARILNTYGPTEVTVATTWVVVDDVMLAGADKLPIGYPKRGSEVFVQNGELCIAGPHVMRGYLNREDLNATRMFLHNGARAFRSGDLGAVDERGLLFCHGRMDDQVKVGGYRIELMEIDAALGKLPGVHSAAAVPLRRPDGSVARIVGFVQPASGEGQLPLQDWKVSLGMELPPYMIPSELIPRQTLPVSINFKIDRAKLAQDYRDMQLNPARRN